MIESSTKQIKISNFTKDPPIFINVDDHRAKILLALGTFIGNKIVLTRYIHIILGKCRAHLTSKTIKSKMHRQNNFYI